MSAALRVLVTIFGAASCALLIGATAPVDDEQFATLPNPLHLSFPRDFGAHEPYRTEWWYVTGWLDDNGHPMGFQLTFFRTRLLVATANPSAFAPRQLYFAHAALSDPRIGKVLFAQRAARAGFGLADAASIDTDVHIADWSLRRDAQQNTFVAQASDAHFALDLSLAGGELMLEGPDGRSTKGPLKSDASAYYSVPQLAVTGIVTINGSKHRVDGRAWLDHEWSTSYLDPNAQGWDWVGINFTDGGALMAFRMRRTDGTTLYSAATRRRADGAVERYGPGEVSFAPRRLWRSPHTGVAYPVDPQITLGGSSIQLNPLMDDQEIDAGQSTGTVYWEGAVRAFDPASPSVPLGDGYLELTGYGERLRF